LTLASLCDHAEGGGRLEGRFGSVLCKKPDRVKGKVSEARGAIANSESGIAGTKDRKKEREFVDVRRPEAQSSPERGAYDRVEFLKIRQYRLSIWGKARYGFARQRQGRSPGEQLGDHLKKKTPQRDTRRCSRIS